MNGILYDPDDADFIAAAHRLCQHIPTCRDCISSSYMDDDNAAAVTGMFKALNDISMNDIPLRDYDAAVEFCAHWLQIHSVLSYIDDLSGVIHGTVQ